MKYELLYEGSDPPGSFDGLTVIGVLTQSQAEANFAAGRLQNSNWSLIVRDGGATKYFSPPGNNVPKPINPGNPYFGKKRLETKDFFALTGQTLGTRYPRLRNDAAFLWVYDVLTKVETVDVDDKAGQFLGIVAYLTNTNAQDGQRLMSNADLAAIMTAWPSA